MAEEMIVVSKNEGEVTVDVMIGQAQQGTYRIYLWDQKGQNPERIGAGVNWDNIADTVSLPMVDTLSNRAISWEMIISAPSGQQGQLYSTNIVFRQNGRILKNYPDANVLQGSKFIAGAVKISVI